MTGIVGGLGMKLHKKYQSLLRLITDLLPPFLYIVKLDGGKAWEWGYLILTCWSLLAKSQSPFLEHAEKCKPLLGPEHLGSLIVVLHGHGYALISLSSSLVGVLGSPFSYVSWVPCSQIPCEWTTATSGHPQKQRQVLQTCRLPWSAPLVPSLYLPHRELSAQSIPVKCYNQTLKNRKGGIDEGKVR